jgi:hypothetical protein
MNMRKTTGILPIVLVVDLLFGCSGSTSESMTAAENDQQSNSTEDVDQTLAQNPVASDISFGTLTPITSDRSENPVAYIPPQCYTDPVPNTISDPGSDSIVKNPCYVCHTDSKRPNYLNDTDVQENYNFPDSGLVNHWNNLQKDRSAQVAAISDQSITGYVREDNYLASNGGIILAAKLSSPPPEWDRNNNGLWDGYIPDSYFSFDESGFDVAPNGEYTGWRVFAYYPFPGTFMPTNGSTDDVMIRLPAVFREFNPGEFDKETYKINLAIVESLLKEQDISITAADENRYGVDLNKDGVLAVADKISYDWAPLEHRYMSYVGQAKILLEEGQIHLAARLFPEGTEFLHSVRYLDVSDGKVTMAPRMKELRYSRKNSWRNYDQLRTIVDKEIKERHDFPARTKTVTGDMEAGLNIPQGWTYQGFIEDDTGQLRPQTHEETYFCTGCHGYIGASNDTTLSFTRKFGPAAFRAGWYHWLEKDITAVADPQREDGRGEYEYYLEHNPTGNEFRTNQQVYNKFFDANGQKIATAFEKLHNDISYLLMPDTDRALMLNKAYKVVVDEQSFKFGRDAHIAPLYNIHEQVESGQQTGIKEILSYY